MKTAILLLVSLASLLRVQAASEAVVVPSASEVIAHLMERDAERQAALSGYTATRRYTLDNKSRHASMTVHVTVNPDGIKNFAIVDESGSGAVRKHVLHNILKEESAASVPQVRDQSKISPENYLFQSAGVQVFTGRRAYVLDLETQEREQIPHRRAYLGGRGS